MRIYTQDEKNKLDVKCRGFLLFMENAEQLNATQRETVIEQVMSLGDGRVSLEDLKWVMMMILGNSQQESSPTQWLESIVFLDENRVVQ
jgi:Smg protein